MLTVFYIIISLIGIAFIIMMTGILLAGRPTKGPRIERYANPQSALLVIDIQEDFTGAGAKKPFPYPNADAMIANVNRAVEAAEKKEMVIAYIRHELPNRLMFRLLFGGRAIAGQSGTCLDQRVKIVNSHCFTKQKGDAFSNPGLNDFFTANRVNQIFLVGLDASGCVLKTAEGAMNRGYGVTILNDAVVSFKYMAGVLKKYHDKGIRVQPAITLS